MWVRRNKLHLRSKAPCTGQCPKGRVLTLIACALSSICEKGFLWKSQRSWSNLLRYSPHSLRKVMLPYLEYHLVGVGWERVLQRAWTMGLSVWKPIRTDWTMWVLLLQKDTNQTNRAEIKLCDGWAKGKQAQETTWAILHPMLSKCGTIHGS